MVFKLLKINMMKIKTQEIKRLVLIVIIINSLLFIMNILILIRYNSNYRHEYYKEMINAYNVGFDDAIKTIKNK